MPASIWLANDIGHSGYERAKRIAGEDAIISPLTIGNVNVLQLDRLTWTLAQGIAKYVKPEDFLLFSGTAIIPAMALLLWVTMHGQCKILLWNAKARDYRQYVITAEGIRELLSREMTR